MDQQVGATCEIEHEKLPPAAYADNPLVLDQTAEFRYGRLGDRPLPIDSGANQGFPNDADCIEIFCDRFNFGQFRHDESFNECDLGG